MSKITINNRDFCRVGSMFLHVVGTNPPRDVIIGAGSSQILDVFDGGESLTIICAPNIVEEVMEEGVKVMRNKHIDVVDLWFDPNMPEDQWPTPENLAKLGKARDTSGDSGDSLQAEDKRRGEQAARRQEATQHPASGQSQGGVSQPGQGYQVKESNEGGKPKVNLTGK